MEKQALQKLIQPILDKHQVIFYDSEFSKEGKEHFLRIFIDKVTGSMDLDTCVHVSEDISLLLDQSDPIGHEYILEVSSAGAERPLKEPQDFMQAIQKYIWVVLKNPVEGFDELIGTLIAATIDEITLEFTIKTRKKTVKIAYSEIEQAITTVKF